MPDTPLDILGGLTPRQAAADPARRPLLVTWAKTLARLCDKQRLAGADSDCNPMLAELNQIEMAGTLSSILVALSIMHPHRPPGIQPDPARVGRWFSARIVQCANELPKPVGRLGALVNEWIDQSPQPAVCRHAPENLAHLTQEHGAKFRPERMVFGAIATLAVINISRWPPSAQ